MVTRVETQLRRLPDMLEYDVVVRTAGGHPIDDQIGHRAVRGLDRLLGAPLLGFGEFDVGSELSGMREQLVALGTARMADLLAQHLLLGTQRVGGGNGLTAPFIGGDQRVDGGLVFPAGTLRGAHPVGVLPQHFEVDHGRSA